MKADHTQKENNVMSCLKKEKKTVGPALCSLIHRPVITKENRMYLILLYGGGGVDSACLAE